MWRCRRDLAENLAGGFFWRHFFEWGLLSCIESRFVVEKGAYLCNVEKAITTEIYGHAESQEIFFGKLVPANVEIFNLWDTRVWATTIVSTFVSLWFQVGPLSPSLNTVEPDSTLNPYSTYAHLKSHEFRKFS